MYTTINGSKIYYQKVGKGKDLVMLHGWGQDVSTFWPDIEFLKDNFSLWLLDLPGFGKSDNPNQAFGSKDYAQVLEKFIKQERIDKPILLGHSYGGKISIKFASLYPSLISKLILVGASGIKPALSFKTVLIYPLAKIVHYLIPDIFNLKSLLRKKFYRRIESDYENAGIMKDTLIETIKEDLTADLRRINIQTLVLWGDKDRAVPLKYGKLMYRLIKDSKLVVFEDKGHFLHVHDPERFAYYVKDFS